MKPISKYCLVMVACYQILASPKPAAADADRPNVIVIISDDAGYVDFGFQGSELGHTPHLDAMAQGGVRFTQGYVSASVCSPSRAGLITGRYQQRFGHEGNLSNPALGLPTTESTIADLMCDADYETVAIGKWHLGYQPEYHPLERGFDEFYGMLSGGRSYFPIRGRNPGHGAILHDHEQIEENEITYLTDDLGGFAADYIRREREDPFFMYLAFNAPHSPMHAIEDDLALFEGVENRGRRTNAAMTYALDRAIGNLFNALEETGQLENTMIVFINDNGGATGNSSDNGPLRGMKGSKWEGGVRVPFMIHWPAQLEGGTTYDLPVISLDILPTALAAAEIDLDMELEIDGVDLLPYLRDEVDAAPHETLFWRRYVAAAVRQGDWKLVRSDTNPLVLINLAEDPGERTNVALDHPEVAARMLADLEEWEAELAPPLWREGDRWENNQILKHRMDVLTREQERHIP